MPELPDVAVLAEAFHAALVGRPITDVSVVESLVVRGTPAESAALAGQRLLAVRRRGKFLILEMESDRLVMNPMLSGRLGFAPPGSKPYSATALVVRFGPRQQAPADAATWTHGADWLPIDTADTELRLRDATRMGKVYLQPRGIPRPIAGWDEQGPDGDDPALDLAAWRSRIGPRRGELKNLLRDQAFVAGIGNGYSDEILWAAGLAPFRKRSSLAAEEVDHLYAAMRQTLAWAVDELRRRVPPRFEVEVRDFLRVHRHGGEACPRCATRISEIAPGGFVTSFCRGCQR
jgi:formamidopyrimidine-DNA glycosylase